jgi:hypothetical protein
MPDSHPQNIDVVKLYELLRNTEQQQQIGRRVLRAVIIDVLRSKSGGTDLVWFRRLYGGQSCVVAVLQELTDDVSLTEEERRILDELEREEKESHNPGGK